MPLKFVMAFIVNCAGASAKRVISHRIVATDVGVDTARSRRTEVRVHGRLLRLYVVGMVDIEAEVPLLVDIHLFHERQNEAPPLMEVH